MIVVDSSGWIEYLLDEANAGEFAPAIESRELVIPTICVYEVQRFFLSRTSDPELFKKLREAMSGGVVVPLQASLAMEAANLFQGPSASHGRQHYSGDGTPPRRSGVDAGHAFCRIAGREVFPQTLSFPQEWIFGEFSHQRKNIWHRLTGLVRSTRHNLKDAQPQDAHPDSR